jgi:hypothetical protein
MEKAGLSCMLNPFRGGIGLIESMRLPLITFVLLVTLIPDFARPTRAETPSLPVLNDASQPRLPACVNSEPAIAEIKRGLTVNGANAKKYDGYRRLLASDADVVLAARLAYAETKAANCAAHNDEVLDLVASVIANRIRIRRGDVKSVVFQRNQFASSLHIYSESRYRDFLCPGDVVLWQKAVGKMRARLEGWEPSLPVPKDAVNYYLHQHSDRFVAPDWKLEEIRVASEEVRRCVRVFRDSGWR